MSMTFRKNRRNAKITAVPLRIEPKSSSYHRILWFAFALILVVIIGFAAYHLGAIKYYDHDKIVSNNKVLNQQIKTMKKDFRQQDARLKETRSNLQVERATQTALGEVIRDLEEENNRLLRELAVFKRISGGRKDSPEVGLKQFRADLINSEKNQWLFTMVVVLPANKQRQNIRVKMRVRGQENGKTVNKKFPTAAQKDTKKWQFDVARVIKWEESIQLSPRFVPTQSEVTVYSNNQELLTTSVTMKED